MNTRRTSLFALLGGLALGMAMPLMAEDQPAPAPQPYDFRGFQPGMSLAEFKAMAPPVDHTAASSTPVCVRLVDPDDAQRSVLRCSWQHQTPDHRSVASVITLGDIPTRAYSFVFFASRKGDEPRLQQIRLAMPSAARARAFRRLSEKFGQPASTDVDDDLWTARWSNGVSSVCLQSSVADASTTVTYRLKPSC
ncbi:MAG: hypothetical protein P4L83_25605 [Nevskia sp.]|nr:hypothetical protein [Nevskia sp.]